MKRHTCNFLHNVLYTFCNIISKLWRPLIIVGHKSFAHIYLCHTKYVGHCGLKSSVHLNWFQSEGNARRSSKFFWNLRLKVHPP